MQSGEKGKVKSMKTFEITYKDADNCTSTITLTAESAEELGQAIMDYIDEKYGVDSYTDGTSVWYTDEDGEQHIVMNCIEFEELEEE